MGSVNDQIAANTVAQVLCSKAFYVRTFSIGGYTIGPFSLMSVGVYVSQGKIGVDYRQSLKGEAEYDSTTNTFHVGFTTATGKVRRGLIIHEAVHAALDAEGAKNIKRQDSEAMAYIAQCQFVRALTNKSGERLYSDEPDRDAVFEVGWALAKKIADGGSLNGTDIQKMRDAVARHPFYKDNATQKAGFDGI